MTWCNRVWILIVILGALSPEVLAGGLRSEQKQAVLAENIEKRRRLSQAGDKDDEVLRRWRSVPAVVVTEQQLERQRQRRLKARDNDQDQDRGAFPREWNRYRPAASAAQVVFRQWCLSLLGLVWFVLVAIGRTKHRPSRQNPC